MEATQRLDRWIYRNLQWTAAVALIVVINGRWLIQHQVPKGSIWSLGTMTLGIIIQITWQLWFLNRVRYIRRIFEAS
ncbi:MAG: hypothetical protein C7B47_14400 [Sulfobacillus thermosulfidooxidans]|uniref:Uncharacterized protein n=1 Tax=Sulfobacillus thermosulfidooxidans TaxID=28034 RepID=A0A2T2WQV0_SULTH|nr:MAG: hypothetical protein C7B47_14400 [Sulfobacillus thermosulfidooxidans]